MTALINALDIRNLLRKQDIRPTTILILATVILTLDRYFGSTEFATHTFAEDKSLVASYFMFASAFLLLGLVPLLLSVGVFRQEFGEVGLGFGDWRLGLKLNLIIFPVIAVTLLYPASQTEEMRSFYPLAAQAHVSFAGFVQLQLPRVIFFYTAWEFFFRGFMLFGLRPYVGSWMAICIQTLPQCLWHIGMPTGEIFSSIAGGILFGLIALRTNSIFWPLLLHCLIGVVLDAFIVLTP